MAERRMFAKSIIGSARFLRMPPSSRLLYYDLGMQADDDGVVEAFTVMRTTGATEDDLRILCSKGFVVVLNEDLVSYITDWKRNNLIKNDRYHPSIYADLLVKIQRGTQMEPEWNPDGNQLESEVRIGKTRLGKVREDEDDDASSSSDLISYFVSHGGKEPSKSAAMDLDKYVSLMGKDVCRRAIDAAIDAGVCKWGYVRGILENKRNQGVRTIVDWDRIEAERGQDKTEESGNFHGYQIDSINLDE